MVDAIKQSKTIPLDQASYKYSGLIFLLLPELIENVLHSNYEEQLQVNIYNPLGLSHTLYHPTSKFPLSSIVPTEYDSLWRKQLVRGSVHDEAAAMLDSKSCNAGLFSTAEDVTKIFQMLLNKGMHGEKQLISQETIKEFTSYQYPEKGNRRGLGFDKPLLAHPPGGNE